MAAKGEGTSKWLFCRSSLAESGEAVEGERRGGSGEKSLRGGSRVVARTADPRGLKHPAL